MRKGLILGSIICLSFAACAVPFRGGPSQEDMARADFGPPPEDPEETILAWMNENLKDPISAKLEILALAEKSWWGYTGALLQPRDIHYSWLVKARIMAKNSFGAYEGWKPYNFFFRDGKIVFTQTS